uniref:RPW8 domain-containing protein n=1 Tax=Cucumis sativus TaxID=3659 RepID=A0A0A0KFQ5_CUCSA
MVVEELLVGAALGALLGELLKGVMNLMEKSVHFKPELELLKSQIEFLQPLVDQVDELGEDFKLRYSDQTLKILIRKGKQLIRECNDAAIQNTLSRYFKIQLCYTKDLRRLDAELKRAGSNLRLELYVQQMKKLQALEINYNNDGRYGRILDRAKLIVTSILTHVGYNFTFVTNILDKLFSGESGSNNNKYNIKLPLLFYHDQRLKGKAGVNSLHALLGRAVEHIKDDPKKGRIAGIIEEIIKKWGEGRFEKIFHRTFETTIVAADEKLQIWFACNLSTTRERGENETVAAFGVLFVSSAKLAFWSFKPTPLPHSSNVNTQSLYLKVVIPLEVLKDVEYDGDQKCIRVIAIDDQKFEFMNFRNYNFAKEGIQQIPLAPIWTR